MEPDEVTARYWDQGRQPSDKVQRLEQAALELVSVAGLTVARSTSSWAFNTLERSNGLGGTASRNEALKRRFAQA